MLQLVSGRLGSIRVSVKDEVSWPAPWSPRDAPGHATQRSPTARDAAWASAPQDERATPTWGPEGSSPAWNALRAQGTAPTGDEGTPAHEAASSSGSSATR